MSAPRLKMMGFPFLAQPLEEGQLLAAHGHFSLLDKINSS